MSTTVLESKVVSIAHQPNDVYHFLADLNNHQYIMPSQVVDFKGNETECAFTITGTGNLSLKRDILTPNTLVQMVPNGKVPFQFNLKWTIEPSDNGCKVQAVLSAELNFIMKSLAAGPLKNFIDMQADGLVKHFN